MLPESVSKAPPKTLASLCLPTQAALQWEHWFCCGGFAVGAVRQTLRLCLLARSNLGYPYIPREYRASSRGGAAQHKPPERATTEPREYRASSRDGAARHEPPGRATPEPESARNA